MAYITGLILLAIAAAYGWSGWRHIKSVEDQKAARAAAGQSAAPPELHPSLSIMVDVMPGITIFMVACLGGFVSLTFFAAGASRYLSIFDLLAFLVLLAAYCFWLTARTKFRKAAVA